MLRGSFLQHGTAVQLKFIHEHLQSGHLYKCSALRDEVLSSDLLYPSINVVAVEGQPANFAQDPKHYDSPRPVRKTHTCPAPAQPPRQPVYQDFTYTHWPTGTGLRHATTVGWGDGPQG